MSEHGQAGVMAGGTQADAAVTDATGRPSWCHGLASQKKEMKRCEPAWCTFHIVGGHWVGKAPPRQTPTLLLEPRSPVHEDGVHDRDAP